MMGLMAVADVLVHVMYICVIASRCASRSANSSVWAFPLYLFLSFSFFFTMIVCACTSRLVDDLEDRNQVLVKFIFATCMARDVRNIIFGYENVESGPA